MNTSYRKNINSHWHIISSEELTISGAEISTLACSTEAWHACDLPTTVLGALYQAGQIPDPNYGTNLRKVDKNRFEKPWWFRHVFSGSDLKQGHLLLQFEGINHRAHIWLNGRLLNSIPVEGAYRQWSWDITSQVHPKDNVLAIEVFPAKPGDYNIGFVDWNPPPPDRSMGIFRPVILRNVGKVSIGQPFVETQFVGDDLHKAELTVSCILNNHSDQEVNGTIDGILMGDVFSSEVYLQPYEEKQVRLLPQDHPALIRDNPQLWWPYQLGEPYMHELTMKVSVDGQISDRLETLFGIRTVADYITSQGHRGFKVNGRPLLIKGAGWTDDIFLRDTPEFIHQQLEYVRQMNINCIRLEGFWGKDQSLYDLCDRLGILMMVGWSCHWEHEQYLGKKVHPKYGGVTEPQDIDLIARSWADQIRWLRHHPSIFVWTVASDMLPHPDLEKRYIETFATYDATRPYLNSTGGIGSEQGIITSVELVSDISGSSRVKMLGPYAYTPPVYWYTNQHLGGAYGFNTETCPGANIPVAESLIKMLPADQRWPVSEVWKAHCGLNSFSTLDRILEAIEKRYGSSDGLEALAKKAQMLNYELMRPMFEAFQAHHPRATGVIQWMLNSAWSSMYWQLFDAFLHPTGAFYAAKKACEPLHLIYNYGTQSVMLINELGADVSELHAQITLYDKEGNMHHRCLKNLSGADFPCHVYSLPAHPVDLPVLFLDLRLLKGDECVNKNFYWLSSTSDELDYDAEFEDWAFHTPSKAFADYWDLSTMPNVDVDLQAQYLSIADGKALLKITLENLDDHLGFFLYIEILDAIKESSILPVIIDDNYVSLLPKEKIEIVAEFSIPDHLQHVRVQVSGWNVAKRSLQVNRENVHP